MWLRLILQEVESEVSGSKYTNELLFIIAIYTHPIFNGLDALKSDIRMCLVQDKLVS